MFPDFIVLPIMNSGDQVANYMFNFFFSLPMWIGIVALIPALCIRILSRS